MKTLWILSFFFVQTGVLTAPIHVSGTKGGKVELTCPYPEHHKYTPKYFCREPCGWSDVLITSGDRDKKGRYLAVDTISARTFSVIIYNLRLADAGVYYCGLSQWGSDTKTKVVLTVSKAPTPVSPPSTTKPPTHLQDTTSSTVPPTDSSFKEQREIIPSTETQSNQSASSTIHSTTPSNDLLYGEAVVTMVCGMSQAVLVSCVLLSLVILYRKRIAAGKTHGLTSSASAAANQTPAAPPQAAEDAVHVYDEMMELTVYGAVQFYSDPQGEPSDPYSLVQPTALSHNMDHLRGRPAQQASHTDTTGVYSIIEGSQQASHTDTTDVYSIIEGSQQPPSADSSDVYSLLAPH
ncbi:CMRF35-like molecule 8 [Alosa sapidissima]|uniref:CMRF35-like molecule 8 n=1 Tax=Alosa sapidissima TaxID=34773 RepID=UPI001C094162|nr:CMRF35-like molecule 8 [Alosa sapidissima]